MILSPRNAVLLALCIKQVQHTHVCLYASGLHGTSRTAKLKQIADVNQLCQQAHVQWDRASYSLAECMGGAYIVQPYR